MLTFIRRLASTLLVLAIFACLVGFAYFTNVPDSPILERAESWPYVGDLAGRFRQHYLGPPPGDDSNDESDTDEVILVDQHGNEITGPINLTGGGVHPEYEGRKAASAANRTSASPQRATERAPTRSASTEPASTEPATTATAPTATARPRWGLTQSPRVQSPRAEGPEAESPKTEVVTNPLRRSTPRRQSALPIAEPTWQASSWRWFLPEQPLRTQPASGSSARGHLSELSYLPVLAEKGGWVEIVHAGERAWVDNAWQPPHKRKAARRGILRQRAEPVRGSNPAALRRARKKFGLERSERTLGPYRLYSDVEDAELLAFLDPIASMAEDGYFARYGRLPSGDPLRSVILFAEESAYRAFAEAAELPISNHGGYATQGVAITYVGDRTRDDVASVIVHELGHLLTRRALTSRLPPWLNEGIADELSFLWFEKRAEERMRSAASGGRRQIALTRRERRLLTVGAKIENGTLPRLSEVIDAGRDRFYTEGQTLASYPIAGLFVRFLLDGEDRRYADGFRDFLGDIAAGRAANLLASLEVDGISLEKGFLRFAVTEYQAVKTSLGIE